MKEKYKWFADHYNASQFAKTVRGSVYPHYSTKFHEISIRDDFPEAKDHFKYVVVWLVDYTPKEDAEIKRRCPFI